ncbi:MAG: hypothetical protein DCC67_02195 [Planctomycetota bacterium]|nr:MAG: hypothetical protein DCC67_02195 [Planctomycetota bacterium]
MTTIVLNADTSQMPIARLIEQVNRGGVEIQDANGNAIAVVLPAAEHAALVYAEAFRDIEEHRSELQAALARRGGVTTAELLRRAAAAAAAQQP